MIALAALDRRQALLICTGYKEPRIHRLALLGRQLGKNVIHRRRTTLRN